jgi:ubiquinone/menaquinone biosynthesis C-methylase UbiE
MEVDRITSEVDEMRARLHGMWASVAPGWAEHADFIDTRGLPVTERMLELTAPRAGERVLELASGPGSLALAASPLVGEDGEIVVSDVASEMTAIAAARATARSLRNVTARDIDLEAIDEPDGSFDVVLCREGMMLVPDPARAASEIRRVLRPDGRAAVAVWGPRERNPWLSLIFDAISDELGVPIPPPNVPGPFSLDDADVLASVVSGAGLSDVRVTEVGVPLRAGSVSEWSSRVAALAGPLANMLAALPADAARALRGRLEEAAQPYVTEAGVEFPGVSLVATARR